MYGHRKAVLCLWLVLKNRTSMATIKPFLECIMAVNQTLFGFSCKLIDKILYETFNL